MSAITKRWEKASPKTKRFLVIGGGLAVLLVILYMFIMATPSTQDRQTKRDTVVENILTGANTRELGITGLGNRTRKLEVNLDNLSKQIDRLAQTIKEDSEKAKEQRVSPYELNQKLGDLRDQLESSIRHSADNQPVYERPSNESSSGDDDDEVDDEDDEPFVPDVSSEIWQEDAPVSRGGETSAEGNTRASTANASQINIRTIGDEAMAGDEDEDDATGEKTDVYMPAGSIVTGVMITGMDAPTNNAARSEPFPALIRVKKEAILPNRYRVNVRECFIISSGYGDLSAERAYLRAETLSCVRDDGGVIEVALNAYAVGEDGKVGMRGRVVSKQGQMLAKSLAAGFFSGMSEVFNKAPIPTIQTSDSGSVQYQDMLSGDSVTAGVAKGASSAMDRLAQYYLDMAKNIFPVIEVNAGRRVDFIVTQGDWLRTVNN